MFLVILKSSKDDSELMMKAGKDLLYFLVPGGHRVPASPVNPFLFFLSMLFFTVSSLPLTHTLHPPLSRLLECLLPGEEKGDTCSGLEARCSLRLTGNSVTWRGLLED